jgi:hypothetical protein
VQVEVSPLENAIYVVENKTQELRTLISQYQHRQHHGNINPLSMLLNGVIDAAVNGGIARYQEVLTERDGGNIQCYLLRTQLVFDRTLRPLSPVGKPGRF